MNLFPNCVLLSYQHPKFSTDTLKDKILQPVMVETRLHCKNLEFHMMLILAVAFLFTNIEFITVHVKMLVTLSSCKQAVKEGNIMFHRSSIEGNFKCYITYVLFSPIFTYIQNRKKNHYHDITKTCTNFGRLECEQNYPMYVSQNKTKLKRKISHGVNISLHLSI